MRPGPLLVALLLLPLAAASAEAQAQKHLMEDPKGDTVFVSGVPGAAPAPFAVSGQTDAADLLALDLVEGEEDVTLQILVAGLGGDLGFRYTTSFRWRDTDYQVDAFRTSNFFGRFGAALLYRVSDDTGRERVAELAMEVDEPSATVRVVVPKVYLLDAAGRSPGRGDAFSIAGVLSEETTFRFTLEGNHPASVRDVMPDAGDPVSFVFQKGDLREGHLALSTEDRVRVSNGGATTFVYQVTVTNSAPYAEEVDLTLGDLPEGWNGTVQSPVKVPARDKRTVAVLASVPFAHKHGGFDAFTLTATTAKDAGSRAVLRLGVLHTPIPQPAGHHSELYLHGESRNGGPFGTLFPFTSGYINTDATHEGEPDAISPNGFRSDAIRWILPLDPQLRMGLDFELERLGSIEGSILGRSTGPAVVAAKLQLARADPEDEGTTNVLLAEAKGETIALEPNRATPFKLVLTPTEQSDYVPYQKDQNLVLTISINGEGIDVCCFGGHTGPLLQTKDFKMVLPLKEYHDQLTGVAEVTEALDLVAEGPVQKAGRPDSILTYVFSLRNHGATEIPVRLQVAGNDAAVGAIIPGGVVRLKPGEPRRVTLAVHIPGDAAEGTELEVLVFAHAQDDPSTMAIARTHTAVTLGAGAVDDETDVLLAARDAERPTPGAGLPWVVAVLALLGVALRRRG